MTIRVFCLNAFTESPLGGNPAGVVLDAEHLTESQMQEIAQWLGFSETAFIQPSAVADYQVRFFTPNGEVDLCGHATIATFSLLCQKALIGPGWYKQETKAGILPIEVKANQQIFMDQNQPLYDEPLEKALVLDALRVSENVLAENLPLQVVSTGLRDLLVPIKNLETLWAIQPDFEKITQISKAESAVGMHLFTLETKFNNTAHCRNFAPLYDIPEEAATGTSNGALSCYLFAHGLVNSKQAEHLVFEQGYSMNRPSEILAEVNIQNNTVQRVRVGGSAVIIEEKVFQPAHSGC